MTICENGEQIEKEKPPAGSEESDAMDVRPTVPIQRLAHERFACTAHYPDGRRCSFARVDPDDPDGRCLLPEHRK
ncbi:hypothetical protein A2765_01575 [Candidatus Kaiserbacteria bacterium RIFCSPHIGHO2_01_FULL_56_24]|uniref:Uncharacterized protein n=1 Tax=Candidatus Kaiserbacteria bacterium RIFCSPHIGHO2_01_FULL_56_24 TaxID=1798487 RepID=A0A1F6DH55_9BACT|nr:MAG: hypothetical protein A2765_01575 [Candidatus Kaiserbacteria bacterium RIFCSPHIGHO2_01_FULL_56_24]